jgi:N-methylhydantoinase B
MIVGAFSLAMPERLPAGRRAAAASSTCAPPTAAPGASPWPRSTRSPAAAAAWPHGDGQDGSNAFLKNTPIEITEAEVPIRSSATGWLPDSGGAGRWRGGLATQMEFQVFSPNTRITARNRDRSLPGPGARWAGFRAEPSET